ncbi:MAG: VOC family protein [Streptosporangiaceae bacterium]
MTHHSRLYKVVVDVPESDFDREAEFWEGALGTPLVTLEKHPEYRAALLHGQEFALLVQRLDVGSARVHLDIHTDDLEAEVARLERLGATRLGKVDFWWVMQDPVGLPLCVLPDLPGELDDTNSTRWD